MGTLITFPRKNNWSPMEWNQVQAAFAELMEEARKLHELADQLSWPERKKLMADITRPVRWSRDYEPWGGLFPNPLYKEEP